MCIVTKGRKGKSGTPVVPEWNVFFSARKNEHWWTASLRTKFVYRYGNEGKTANPTVGFTTLLLLTNTPDENEVPRRRLKSVNERRDAERSSVSLLRKKH